MLVHNLCSYLALLRSRALKIDEWGEFSYASSLSLCLSIHYCVTLSPNTSLHLARTLSNSLSVAENLHLTSDRSKPVAEVHAENIFSAS